MRKLAAEATRLARERTSYHAFGTRPQARLATPLAYRNKEHKHAGLEDVTSVKGLVLTFTPLLLGWMGLMMLLVKLSVWGGRPPRLGNRSNPRGKIAFAVALALITIIILGPHITVMRGELIVAATPLKEEKGKVDMTLPDESKTGTLPTQVRHSPPSRKAARRSAVGSSSTSASPFRR